MFAVSLVNGEPALQDGKFINRNNWYTYGFRNPVRSYDVRDCSDPANPYYPPTTTITTERIEALRDEMVRISDNTHKVKAYIIPAVDAHQSGYIAECDKRRDWITGFDGSAGMAIVTDEYTALWTDSRYYLQAERQLDCNWILMKSSDHGTPDPWEWLEYVLHTDSDVAFDPTLMSMTYYDYYEKTFYHSVKDIRMYAYDDNLIDNIWTERPNCPDAEPLFILDPVWTGITWGSKILEIRDEMRRENVDMLVVHALDESAWMYNMRGVDIPYNPVYFSYTIVTFVESIVFIQSEKVQPKEIRDHLKLDEQEEYCNTLGKLQTEHCVRHYDYELFTDELSRYSNHPDIRRVWISDAASYAIHKSIQEDKIMMKQSPVMLIKSIKNAAEIAGMKEGNIQDAIAVIEFYHWLEGQVPLANGDINLLSELICEEKVLEFRMQQPDFVMESFGPISAFGPNGAVIHYKATPETNLAITDKDMYLIDSGGQYKCGTTTDTTRTFHFGTPREEHKQAYTRVLMGAIDLSLAIYPERTMGSSLDSFSRRHLWNIGWDFGHSPGHGIGACLNVHEGPSRIGKGGSKNEEPLFPGMFLSDEPGYYEDHNFGVRLETVFMVVETQTQENFGNQTWTTFDEVAFVPFQYKLIKFEMMTPPQIDWMNRYNQEIRFHIGDRLYTKNRQAYDWMIENTKPVYGRGVCGANGIIANTVLVVALSLSAFLLNQK
ncbi:xaa-Pro aminopeptidase 1-like [Glandiceps talaboti]